MSDKTPASPLDEIDFSDVPAPVDKNLSAEDWEPPTHKYFGKKDANGKMEKEPVYVHQEYPRLMYSKPDKKIVARMVYSDEEVKALGEGWEKTPAAFGLITAPSVDQILAQSKKSNTLTLNK